MAPHKHQLTLRREDSFFQCRGIEEKPRQPRHVATAMNSPPTDQAFARRPKPQFKLLKRRVLDSEQRLVATETTMLALPNTLAPDSTCDTAPKTSIGLAPPPNMLGGLSVHDNKSDPELRPTQKRTNINIGMWRDGVARHSGANPEEAATETIEQIVVPKKRNTNTTLNWSVELCEENTIAPLAVSIPQHRRAVLIETTKATVTSPYEDDSSDDEEPVTALPMTPRAPRTPRCPRTPRGHTRQISKETISSSSAYTSQSETDDESADGSVTTSITSMDSDSEHHSGPSKDKSLPPTPPSGSSTASKRGHGSKPRRSPPLKSARPTLRHMNSTSTLSCKSLGKLNNLDDEFLKTDPYSDRGSLPPSPTFTEVMGDLQKTLHQIPSRKVRSRSGSINSVGTTVSTTPSEQRTALSRSSSRDAPILRKLDQCGDLRRPKISPLHGHNRSASAPIVPKSTRSEAPESFQRYSITASDFIDHYLDNSSVSSSPEQAEFLTAVAARPTIVRAITAVTPKTITEEEPLQLLQAVAFTPEPKKGAREEAFNDETKARRHSRSARMSILIPEVVDDGLIPVRTSPSNDKEQSEQMQRQAEPEPEAAICVLLNIMSAVTSLRDLDHITSINKDMRRVYKENEMPVLKAVCKNQSTACWELREWAPPFSLEQSTESPIRIAYTPRTYRESILRDAATLSKLKLLILARCQSFLRSETVAALSSEDDVNAQRFDDALYRLWTFCKIFGGEKGREEDVTGQLDWLKGGLLAHQDECGATATINMAYNFDSVLLNAPEYFGECNKGGISADGLYDMTELWNCLASLMQGYVGKVSHARTNGVFSKTDVNYNDTEKQEALLEEWIYYVLSVGPDAVLKMAELSDHASAGFSLARNHGWMKWSPPMNGSSRSSFFREPVARLYEERMMEASVSTLPKSTTIVQQKEQDRRRTAQLAQEIRLARHSSGYRRMPLIDMANERPMSTLSMFSSHGTLYLQPNKVTNHVLTIIPSPEISPKSLDPNVSPQTYSSNISHYSTISALTVDASCSPPLQAFRQIRKVAVSPIVEEQPAPHLGPYNLTNLQTSTTENYIRTRSRKRANTSSSTYSRPTGPSLPARGSSAAHKTGGSGATMAEAIKTIVDLGFTVRQAREALKVADNGDGINVEYAIDLLSQQQLAYMRENMF